MSTTNREGEIAETDGNDHLRAENKELRARLVAAEDQAAEFDDRLRAATERAAAALAALREVREEGLASAMLRAAVREAWERSDGTREELASLLMALDPENRTGYFHGDPPWPEAETEEGRMFLRWFASALARQLRAL